MQRIAVFRKFLVWAIWSFAIAFPNGHSTAVAQQNPNSTEFSLNVAQYQRLTFQKLALNSDVSDFSVAEDLDLEPLTAIESNIASNLNSHWAWDENTLEMIDSYAPFLFRTKKSRALDEVKILLDVNSRGRVSGFEVIGEVDKGLKERLDHVFRKLHDCKPVPGFVNYSPERFELTIRK